MRALHSWSRREGSFTGGARLEKGEVGDAGGTKSVPLGVCVGIGDVSQVSQCAVTRGGWGEP